MTWYRRLLCFAVAAAFWGIPLGAQRADYRQREDSTRKAVADSIALHTPLQRIRGTVTNHQTGLPFAYAQIFVRSHFFKQAPRIVTDSRGHYEIKGMPAGTVMLEVQCPGNEYRTGATLDAPSLYLFPGMDTVINMSVPDVRPCWNLREPRRIESGRASVSVTSPPPTGNEARVYSAVTEMLIPGTVGNARGAALMYSTMPNCSKGGLCGRAQLVRLQRAGTLEASTVEAFRKNSSKVSVLSSGFALSIGLDLVTPDDIDYVRQEARVRTTFRPSDRPDDDSTFWDAFRSAYADTAIISFTGIGFNDSGTQALVEALLETRGSPQKPELFMLSLSDGGWKVLRRHIEVEKTAGRFVAGECVPTAARMLASKELRQIEGLYRVRFVSEVGGPTAIERNFSFVPDSILRREYNALSADSIRRLSSFSSFPFPSEGGIPSFELIDANGNRNEGTEFGMSFFSGSVAFNRFKPAFNPDGVIGSGEDLEILDVSPNGFGGQWIDNRYRFFGRTKTQEIPSQGYFCAERIGPFVMK